MRIFFISMILFLILFSACSYSRFTITGVPYEPLPEDREIKVIPEEDLSKFDQIGIAEIKNSDKEYRIKEAKRLARLHGGDVIMPMKDENLKNPKVQSFRVLVPVQEEMEDESKEYEKVIKEQQIAQEAPKPDIKTKQPQAKEKPDYSNLPIVPYKILVGEFANLKGERFKALMYPKKVTGFPNELRSYAKENKKLIELGTKKGNNIVYLITNNESAQNFQQRINSKQGLQFVYTPVALYKFQYPVLELIDIID